MVVGRASESCGAFILSSVGLIDWCVDFVRLCGVVGL